MNRKALVVLSALTAIFAGLAGFLFLSERRSLHGSVIDPPLAAAELKLTDERGLPFTLSQLRGNVVLIYFGYTQCLDECPLTMANLSLAFDMLGDDAPRGRVVMITTDPARDTQSVLRDFLGRFDGGFIGLTGTPEELAKTRRDYGVTVMDGGETHSNYIYVIDQQGNLVETVPFDAQPADIATDIRVLLDRD